LLKEALLTDPDAEYHDVHTWFGLMEHDAYKEDPQLCTPACPLCGAPLQLGDIWLKRGNTGYYTEAVCPPHGPWFVRFKLSRRDGPPGRLCPLEAPGGGPARADAPPRRAGSRCRPGRITLNKKPP